MTHEPSPAIAAAHSGVRWSLRIAVLGLFFVLVVYLAWGVWWSRHPNVFEPVLDTATVDTSEVTPLSGGPLHIDMYLRKRDPSDSARLVTLASVEPNILVNEADAEITFHLCWRPKRDRSIGSVRGDLSDWCTKVFDVDDGTELPLASGGRLHGNQLIMTITPRRPGGLVVQGMDLTYRHGVQTGTQRVGEHVSLRFA